jgi:hypothetical protein
MISDSDENIFESFRFLSKFAKNVAKVAQIKQKLDGLVLSQF